MSSVVAGIIIILGLLVVYRMYNMQKAQAVVVPETQVVVPPAEVVANNDRASTEAVQGGMQVGLIPQSFPYSQDLVNLCLQAAQQGYTPGTCLPFYQYTQANYPSLAPYIQSYYPYWYNNYWPSYYGHRNYWWSGRGGRNHWNRGHNWNRGGSGGHRGGSGGHRGGSGGHRGGSGGHRGRRGRR